MTFIRERAHGTVSTVLCPDILDFTRREPTFSYFAVLNFPPSMVMGMSWAVKST